MTWTDIINEITLWIKTNGNREITGAQLREILLNMSGMNYPIIPVHVITNGPQVISEIAHGSEINGHIISVDEYFLALAQVDTSENGIYKVGQNPGDTDRHPDYPDATSCANKIIISENPDESGNCIISTVIIGTILMPDIPGTSRISLAEGQVSFNTATKDITFSRELASTPTRIELQFWDSDGMPVSGGYNPASATTKGITVKVPGNEGETIICNYKIKI